MPDSACRGVAARRHRLPDQAHGCSRGCASRFHERRENPALGTELERDAFRIAWSFARNAASEGIEDFPFPVENVGARVGVSYQALCKLRNRFVAIGILRKTADHVVNRTAARFRWLL